MSEIRPLGRAFRLSLLIACVALAASPPASAQESGGYAGDAVCTACHEDVLESYSHTIHAKVLNEKNAPNALAKKGCEACHGPGQAHVDAGGGQGSGGPDWVVFGSDDPAHVARENETCLQCHEGGTQRYWEASPHQARGHACTTCHDVKQPRSDDAMLTHSSQMALCSSCHPMPRSQMNRRSHMPTRPGRAGAGGEGYMNCGSCHNPHGTVTASLVSAVTVNENCYECHAEKRGPFLWEHAPVNESCLNCHVPHGSTRANMLKAPSLRLCQSCHIHTLHPSNTYDRDNRFAVGKQCLNCHQKIHGSNHPSGNLFTR
ncbi:MAG: DmsE family decaheme c-type cytochrome [Myxococcota bacterium]